MATDLRTAIKQQKPFGSPEEEAALNIDRTAAVIGHAFAESLKAYDITPTQYNVLRILRGAPDGLLCGEVGARMITRDPDITRLLDRLEKRSLIGRSRQEQDRRRVLARITDEGLALLKRLDEPVWEMHRRQLGHLGAARRRALAALLAAAREKV